MVTESVRVRLITSATAALVIALAILSIAWPSAARADTSYIYWTANNGSSIGRSNMDGSDPNFSYLNAGGYSWGIAATDQYLYWSVDRSGAGVKIGRADSDGANANPDFVTTTAPPYGLAISGNYIYWTNRSLGSIGRANLDGTGVNQNFITGINWPIDVAVDGSSVYWTALNSNSIGRANLDGTGVNYSLISGAGSPQGLAITSSHLYWTHATNNIGRANLDGTGVNQSFIAAFGSPNGIAIDGSRIYWAETSAKRIMAANLDGTGSSTILVNTVDQPWGVTIGTIRSSTPTSGTGSSVPASIPQSVGIPGSGTCDHLDIPALNWAGTASGGWTKSWAQWPNDGAGGFVCNRILRYSASLAAWQSASLG